MPLIVGAPTRRPRCALGPRHFLFFNRNPAGKAAADYLARLHERTGDRDKPISHQARIAQLPASAGPDSASRTI